MALRAIFKSTIALGVTSAAMITARFRTHQQSLVLRSQQYCQA